MRPSPVKLIHSRVRWAITINTMRRTDVTFSSRIAVVCSKQSSNFKHQLVNKCAEQNTERQRRCFVTAQAYAVRS